jgi:general secretion pathway protein I
MSPPSNERRAEAGFSVVEAMVALAVFALAGVGLVQVQTHSLGALSQTETQAFASIVAQNVLIDAASATAPPDLGAREGTTALAGQVWTWRLKVERSEMNLLMVNVEVLDADGDVIERLFTLVPGAMLLDPGEQS